MIVVIEMSLIRLTLIDVRWSSIENTRELVAVGSYVKV